MFILVNINPAENCVMIKDTKDKKQPEKCNLSQIAMLIKSGELKVEGIEDLSKPKTVADLQPLPNYGIGISQRKAKEAMCRYLVSLGASLEDAKRQVRL